MYFRPSLSQTTNVGSTEAHSQGCVAGLSQAGEFQQTEKWHSLDADITRYAGRS